MVSISVFHIAHRKKKLGVSRASRRSPPTRPVRTKTQCIWFKRYLICGSYAGKQPGARRERIFLFLIMCRAAPWSFPHSTPMVLSLSNTSRQITERGGGGRGQENREEVEAEMTEVRDIRRANMPVIYGTHERMAGGEGWRSRVGMSAGEEDEDEGRGHHFIFFRQ